MVRLRTTLTAAALAAGALLAAAGPAAACPADPRANPTYWEYGGVYDCSRTDLPPGVHTWTKPSAVAFVAIKHGRQYFVSDLGDANEGDRTYTFDRSIRFVVTCLFTDV